MIAVMQGLSDTGDGGSSVTASIVRSLGERETDQLATQVKCSTSYSIMHHLAVHAVPRSAVLWRALAERHV